MKAFVETIGLKKYFDTPRGTLHAVDNVSIQIARGETLGVVGESGCGKSTLGRVILHLLDSTDGQILYNGDDITHAGKAKLRDLRKRMQIIFQDPFASLDPRMTVCKIIAEPLYNNGMRDKSMRAARVAELMDTVGLPPRFSDFFPHELDGGRRQRIGIARALALNPQFIVCDEPVSALDVSIQAQVINLILELQQKFDLTYMFISHDLSVVKYISNNVMVMYLGQTVEYAATDTLFGNPLHPYTQALLSAVPIPETRRKKDRILLKGEITSPINPEPGCRFVQRCIYAEDVCRQKDPMLRAVAPGHQVACHRAGNL